jgi:hypothetical protein
MVAAPAAAALLPPDAAQSGGEENGRSNRASDSSIPERATLSFAVRPDQLPGFGLTVNGEGVSGEKHSVTLGGRVRKVQVVARARGYRTWSRTVTVRGDQTVRIDLKRPRADSAPGGLIDL